MSQRYSGPGYVTPSFQVELWLSKSAYGDGMSPGTPEQSMKIQALNDLEASRLAFSQNEAAEIAEVTELLPGGFTRFCFAYTNWPAVERRPRSES